MTDDVPHFPLPKPYYGRAARLSGPQSNPLDANIVTLQRQCGNACTVCRVWIHKSCRRLRLASGTVDDFERV